MLHRINEAIFVSMRQKEKSACCLTDNEHRNMVQLFVLAMKEK
jgi:hypothetical protein